MVHPIIQDIFDAHFGGTPMAQQLASLSLFMPERPLDPPADPMERQATYLLDRIDEAQEHVTEAQDALDDALDELEVLRREYEGLYDGEGEGWTTTSAPA